MNYKKITIIFLAIFLTTFLTANCLAQNNAGPIELDKSNILPSNLVTITLDGRNIHPDLIKQDSVIYAKGDELLSTFGYKYIYSSDFIKINDLALPTWRSGYVSEKGVKVVYLPLLETLSLLNIRYLYSDIYGKNLIAIRTDDRVDYSTPVYNNEPNNSRYPNQTISSDRSSNNTNVIVNNYQYTQQTAPSTSTYYGGSNLPNVPGYVGPISSVPDLLANGNYNSQVRGFGKRSMLGFYSVYGVEPQPFGTGFPYALGGPNYNYNYPSPCYNSFPYGRGSTYWGGCGMPQPCSRPLYWGF